MGTSWDSNTDSQERSEKATVYRLRFVRIEGFTLPAESLFLAEIVRPLVADRLGQRPPISCRLSRIVGANVPSGKFCRRVFAVTRPAGPAPAMVVSYSVVRLLR